MAVTSDALPVKVEIAWGASPDSDPRTWPWTDVTKDAYTSSDEPSVDITRGTSSEGSDLEPMQCQFTLNNESGDYTPDNPRSRFYPNVRINSPVRVTVTDPTWGRNGLVLSGASWASVADGGTATALTTTAVDVRMDLEPTSWRPTQDRIIAGKWNALDTGQQSWVLSLWTTGVLEYVCIDTTGTVFRARSYVLPEDSGRMVIAVQHDTTAGTVTFLTGPTTANLAVNRVVTGAPTSLHGSTFPLCVGSLGVEVDPLRSKGHRFFPFAGMVYTYEQRATVNGALVASPDFAGTPSGFTQFNDAQGYVWTVHPAARITDPRVRFVGIISDMPPSWPDGDIDTKATVAITATGEVRRQTQKGETFSSAMRRGFGDIRYRNDIVAYWPCEDGELATTAAPGFAGWKYKPLIGSPTPPKFAGYSDAVASGPIPTYSGTGVKMYGAVPTYALDGARHMRLMAYVNVPSEGAGGTDGATVLYAGTVGSLTTWRVQINSAGSLRLQIGDTNGNIMATWSWIGFNLNGQRGAIWLYLRMTNPDDIKTCTLTAQIGFASDAPGDGVGVYEQSTSAGDGHWIGPCTDIRVGSDADLNDMAIGHVAVLRTDQFWDTLNWVKAWVGETAIARMIRLAAEQGHGFYFNGVSAESARVGPQRIQSYLDLMKDAAAADGGLLYEPRDAFGLAYRARGTLYNQDPAMLLDAARNGVGDIINPFQPVADDSGMTNDVTLTRQDGSSVHVVDAAHVKANGTYATETTVNVADDSQLPDYANWTLRQGVWPGMRYTSVTPALDNMPDLIPAWVATDIGDRAVVTNLPRQHAPDPVDLQIVGYSESLKAKGYEATANTAPGALWDSIGYVPTDGDTGEADPDRVDTEGSALAADIDNQQTTITVKPTVGAYGWTTNTADLPFQITVGGERMRVTAVTAMANGVQTFTVERGLNGVTLARPANTPVALAQPAYVAW